MSNAGPPIPLGFQEGFVDLDGFRIRNWVKGEGENLVTIHGGLGPEIGLAEDLLAQNRRVIALEVPGFGASPEHERARGGLEMARVLHDAVAALGIERYTLLGSSMGGVIALWWATEFPGEVSSLVLEAPAALRVNPPDPAFLANREKYLQLVHAHPERKPWLADAPVPTLRNPPLFMALMGPDHDDELVTRMRTLRIPVLVLIGTRDGLVSPRAGRKFVEILPDCYFVLVYDAAHDAKGDRPEAFVNCVEDFLAPPRFLVQHRSSVLAP